MIDNALDGADGIERILIVLAIELTVYRGDGGGR
jgi:hypothetical protein